MRIRSCASRPSRSPATSVISECLRRCHRALLGSSRRPCGGRPSSSCRCSTIRRAVDRLVERAGRRHAAGPRGRGGGVRARRSRRRYRAAARERWTIGIRGSGTLRCDRSGRFSMRQPHRPSAIGWNAIRPDRSGWSRSMSSAGCSRQTSCRCSSRSVGSDDADTARAAIRALRHVQDPAAQAALDALSRADEVVAPLGNGRRRSVSAAVRRRCPRSSGWRPPTKSDDVARGGN